MKHGFSAIEILITVSILAVVALFTIGNGIDTNARVDVAAEHSKLLELLTHARNQAMNNVNEAPHGVYIDTGVSEFVFFEGPSYALAVNTEITTYNPQVAITGLNEVVFEQLSGRATPTSGSVVLSRNASTRSITVNSEGRLDW